MEISSKPKNYNSMSPGPPNPPPTYNNVTPEYPTLIVMIAVLAIILLFCFWGAPGVRDYCRRSLCCCHCRRNDREARESSGTPADDRSATPTIILLPYGRMLVVDRNVFTQLQIDQTGIDFMELSASLIRAHHLQQCGSTPSILDSDTTSKGLSPISLGFSPPSYEDIFGQKNSDLPPSYSELSLMFRQRQGVIGNQELQCLRTCDISSGDATTEVCARRDDEKVDDVSRTSSGASSANCEILSGNNDDDSSANCRYCSVRFENEKQRDVNDDRRIFPPMEEARSSEGDLNNEACCSKTSENINETGLDALVQVQAGDNSTLQAYREIDSAKMCSDSRPNRKPKNEGIRESRL